MDNSEKLAKLGIQDTGWRQTKQKAQYLKQPEVKPGTREGYAVPATYKSPAMLLL
jgi:hypothetical protein